MGLMPSILLVDDEVRFVKSLHTILNHYDYECTEALSGGEAISLVQDRHFDLALLDVGLPDMSGCDVLEVIKTSHKNTAAIMLTGISTAETAVQAMKRGAYDFLNKPINHETLLKTIDKAFQHQKLIRELEASEKRFQILAEASWEGIVIHQDGRLLEGNSQFFAMFGYSERELLEGIFLEKIFTPVSQQLVHRHFDRASFGSHEMTGVKDGTAFPIETNSRSINYLGKPARVCAVRDISERVRSEEETLLLHAKLAKSSKLKALGLMAGSVAHDLNNILTRRCQLSRTASVADRQVGQVVCGDQENCQEAGKRAAAVVADLVVLARGGSSSSSLENINNIILSHLNSIEHCERLAGYPDVIIQTNLQQNLRNTYCFRSKHPQDTAESDRQCP